MPLSTNHQPAVLRPDTQPTVRWVEVGPEHAGQRLDNFLLRLCKGVPKSHLYKAIRGGEVRVNKGRAEVHARLAAGDVVRVPPFRVPTRGAASSGHRPVPAAAFPVVFEDDALLVIDKPAGVAVHGGSGVSFGVIEQLRAANPQAKFLELVHRLDRDTSGLLMLAKRRASLLALHAMLREGRGRKHYLALVAGNWPNDRQHLRMPLTKWLTRTGERRVRVDDAGQPAHTIVEVVQRFNAARTSVTLLRAELRTGRTHQIRVHLAASGFPIVGDDKYGNDADAATFARQGFTPDFAPDFARMFLHAHSLEFPHPITGEPLQLQAPLPADCARLLTHLERN